MDKIKNNLGFTLIELVIVIAILCILASIAVPKFNNLRQKAVIYAHETNVKTLENAALMYLADEGVESKGITWTKEDSSIWKNYIEEWPEVPKGIKKLGKNEEYEVTINEQEIKVTPDSIERE